MFKPGGYRLFESTPYKPLGACRPTECRRLKKSNQLNYCLSYPCAPAGSGDCEVLAAQQPRRPSGKVVFGARHTTRRSVPDTRHAGWRGQSVAVMDDHSSPFVIFFLEFGVWNLGDSDFGASDNGL
jgi:hypothetical protein